MKDYFSYNTGNLPAKAIRISPSQLSLFFDKTSEWWRTHLLGEAPSFLGSTASELGTCIHAAAAMYHDTNTVDKQAILNYIETLGAEIDKNEIRAQLKPMIDTLINTYCLRTKHSYSEEFISYEILPNIYVAGSIDASTANTIVDYKTTSSKSAPSSFPRNYYFQLMTYAWLKRKHGFDITHLRLVYVTRFIDGGYSDKTGKKLKDYESTCTVLNHQITQTDWDLIDGCLNLIAHSIQLWQTHPELRYALAQDYRLKLPEQPKLFKA